MADDRTDPDGKTGEAMTQWLRRLPWGVLALALFCVGLIWGVHAAFGSGLSTAVCGTCGRTYVVLFALVLLSLLQLVSGAVLPAIFLDGLLSWARVAQLIRLTALASAVNSLAPAKAGSLLKAIRFKSEFGIDYLRFSTAHFLSSAIFVLMSLLVATAAVGDELIRLFDGYLSYVYSSVPRWVIFISVVVVLMLTVTALRMRRLRSAWRGYAPRVAASLSVPRVAASVGVGLVQLLTLGARAMLAAALFGANPSWGGLLALGGLLAVAPVFAVLPGGLGVREAVFVLGGMASGVPPAIGLQAALLDRLVGTATAATMSVSEFLRMGRE